MVEQFEGEMNDSSRIHTDNLIEISRIPRDFQTTVLRVMMAKYFRRRTRFKMAVRFVISQV